MNSSAKEPSFPVTKTGRTHPNRAISYDVVLARTGEEALESIQESPCDLVILDLMMPEMDGLEVLGKIVSRYKRVKAVIHTAYPKCKGEFVSWLADAYLTKSTDFSALRQTVGQLLPKEIDGAPRAKPMVPPLKYPPTPRLRRVTHRWRNPPKHQAMST